MHRARSERMRGAGASVPTDGAAPPLGTRVDSPTWKFSEVHGLEFLWRFPYTGLVGQSRPSM